MSTSRVRAVVPALLCLAVGCGDNVRLEGERYQYVVSELQLASDTTTARAQSLDLDGDEIVDNQLGSVFGALDRYGLGVAETARESLLRGGLVMLAELQSTDLEHSPVAGFTTYLGADPVPAPCLDPLRLETCGKHLLGGGEFSVDLASASDLALGPIVDGGFLHRVGELPIEIAIDPTATIRLELHGARVRLSAISEGHITGILAGGISPEDVRAIVIPEAAAQMKRIVSAECGQPTGLLPCGCLDDSRAQFLVDVFDADHDCRVVVDEVQTNSLVRSLLTPDIELNGEDLLSFGVGIELVSAVF